MTFSEGKVSFFNEVNLLNNSFKELDNLLLKNNDNDCKYTMPLVMIILQELYGYTKNDYHYKKVVPQNFLNGKENIKKESTIKKYSLSFQGVENGRILEIFISSNKKIIYTLKFP